MATFKVYMYGKLMDTFNEPRIDTVADFKKSDTFKNRFGNDEYVTWYKVVKVRGTSTGTKRGVRFSKKRALMDYFGYSEKEAKMMLKDMGE
jgi:hypothetical protein